MNAETTSRARAICAKLTLEQKAAQLCNRSFASIADITDEAGNIDLAVLESRYPHGFGGIHVAFKVEPKAYARIVNSLQEWSRKKTGVPVMFIAEGLHGFMAKGATSFPQAIALGSSWDPGLAERVFSVIAREARARGVAQLLAPVLDLGRDPRFGRVEEMFSEDPKLASALGLAAVRGLQGRDGKPGPEQVAATLKHFVGHGQCEGGRNVAPLALSRYDLLNAHLPPFEACVREGKALGVMPSYNEFDGLPNHASEWLLREVLRDELGFDGLLVSDQNAVDELHRTHAVVDGPEEAAIRALKIGIDVDVSWLDGTFVHLPALVRSGRLDEKLVDRAVTRLLGLKLLLGLFDERAVDEAAMLAATNGAEARALALEAAEKSLVLLENKGGLLPLDPAAAKRVAVIGPNAKGAHFGGYSPEPFDNGVDILDGIRNYLATHSPAAEVVHAEGCRISAGDASFWQNGNTELCAPETNRALIAEAVKVAASADLIVLALGENECFAREGWSEDHRGDRDSLALLGEQLELAQALRATGKHLVVLMINGRPLDLSWFKKNADALFEGWYLGQEGGNAFARVLFGEASPSGRLPCTLPKSAGELPCNYDRKPSRLRSYINVDSAPVYPFGFGLTYGEIAYGELKVERAQAPDAPKPGKIRDSDGTLPPTSEVACVASVEVSNSGKRHAAETVQLYVRDRVSSRVRPVMELRAFERVALAPGERRLVRFAITLEDLAYRPEGLEKIAERGDFDIMVGPDCARTQSARFTL